ncbi:MAG: SUMF1/EgtB/PvdO family nonheme iron enzyme, partial [Bacteroidota bacterium]
AVEGIEKGQGKRRMFVFFRFFAHAGSFQWSTGFRDMIFDLPSVIYEERFYQYAKDAAWQVITSSASDQKAVDVLSNRSLGMREEAEENEHSPFALALFDALNGEGDTIPKGEGDGVITASELYIYLRDRVEDETMDHGKRQSPSMFSLSRHNKGQYIFLHPNHRFNLPPIPKRNPFMGLNSYNEGDHSLFYGRERVVTALEELTKHGSLVVVSGASGTGKSSVVKAGLIPQLREKGWHILPILRPGQTPMELLRSCIPDMAQALPPHLPALLFVDQYEELVTQCLDDEERLEFEQQLVTWLETYPQLSIAISIRSDFEPQFEEATLAPYWMKGHYLVPAFSQDELREVIIKPTVQEVLYFEPNTLVDKLVDAVNQAPGALPLLSFTLSELYHSYLNSGRTNRALTLEDYQALGGVIGALRTRANSIYEELTPRQQDCMRKLMLRMVSLEGGELASRRVNEPDVIFTNPADTDDMQIVAEKLVEARLISTGRDLHGVLYYEPAHDALVRAWARLWEWIKGLGENKLRLMHKLDMAVYDYEDHKSEKEAKNYLWNNDPRLSILWADFQLEGHPFNALEVAFLTQSRQLRANTVMRKRMISMVTGLILLAISVLAVHQNIRMKGVLASLQTATQAVLVDLMEDAEVDLQRFRYQDALKKFSHIAGTNQLEGSMREAWTHDMFDLAFFHNEASDEQPKNQAIAREALLELMHMSGDSMSEAPQTKQEVREKLRSLNDSLYLLFAHRYYPSLIRIPGDAEAQIAPYFLAQSETTVWQYALFCKSTGKWKLQDTKPGWQLEGDNPVVRVSLKDAQAYAHWLSSHMKDLFPAQNSPDFRLPTDQEWIFAARGGQAQASKRSFDYCGGIGIDSLAWYARNSGGRTRPVMQKQPLMLAGQALYDMSGNVSEWTTSERSRPLMRNGSWRDESPSCLVEKARRVSPGWKSDTHGFRLAASAPEAMDQVLAAIQLFGG